MLHSGDTSDELVLCLAELALLDYSLLTTSAQSAMCNCLRGSDNLRERAFTFS
jgi:hypothetical protein